MPDGFAIPGAENFARHLEGIVKGSLSLQGPVDRKFPPDSQEWKILVDGAEIGIYKASNSPQFAEYRGTIPGYKHTFGVDEVILLYQGGNRQDFHKPIPFP